MSPEKRIIAGLASAAAILFPALAAAAIPPPFRSVADWAEASPRIMSGGPRDGQPWSNAYTPEAVEPMRCLDPTHPAQVVAIRGAAQMFKTGLGLNWVGQTIEDDPCNMLLALPGLNELRTFNSQQLQPMIDATPALAKRVLSTVERSGAGSTTAQKRFRGGWLELISVGSSKAMQSRTVKRAWGDEIAEWAEDVGGRGDPVGQLIVRGDAMDDFKLLLTSTPKDLPNCRITRAVMAGDQRQRFAPCPQCGDWFVWQFEHLQADGPDATVLVAPCCGHPIPQAQKDALRAISRWIRTYSVLDESGLEDPNNPAPPAIIPAAEIDRWHDGTDHVRPAAGRDPSFTFSQLLHPSKTWHRLRLEGIEAAAQGGSARKTFRQQRLGLPWNPDTESAEPDRIHAAAGSVVRARGRLPSWACRLTGAVDVQGDRIEWAVWAWGPGDTGARIDWGVFEGDPTRAAVWHEAAHLLSRRWPSDHLVDLALDGLAVDSGGQAGVTPRVYEWTAGRDRAYAMKGDTGAQAQPALMWRAQKKATARTGDGRRVATSLHLLANHETKSLVAAGLRTSLLAAEDKAVLTGGLYLTEGSSLETARQLTAESYVPPPHTRPHARGHWQQASGRANEQLDLVRMAMALNWYQTHSWDQDRWAREFVKRAAVDAPASAPLLDLMAANPTAPAEPVTNPTGAEAPRPMPSVQKIGGWFNRT